MGQDAVEQAGYRPGDCLVCGHGAADHEQDAQACVGNDGVCQCHAYNPDQHPAQRLSTPPPSEI